MLFSKYTKGGRHVNDLISRKKGESKRSLLFLCPERSRAGHMARTEALLGVGQGQPVHGL